MKKKNRALHFFTIMTLFGVSLFPGRVHCQSMTLEQKYQDVFVSAGYATAMGAAVGAALLAFQDKPGDHLRYVAIGASVGFFAGTAFGTYVAVAPAFSLNTDQPADMMDEDTPAQPAMQLASADERKLILQPQFNTSRLSIDSIQAGMVFARF